MATPTLSDLSIRLTAVDGVGASVPSSASIPVIQNDLNGLHSTINQLTLVIQSELNTFGLELDTVKAGLAGEASDQAVRLGPVTVPSGTMAGPYSLSFVNAYSDGLYTTEVTAVVGEALSTAPCVIGGVQQQSTPGDGVNVWVVNNDSIDHTVIINVFVRHD